ncbi:hypothetical protein BDR07DRAFT_1425901, partial [Suillus spraguei]
MYTAILLSSPLTMLIPYGGASSVLLGPMLSACPPPTDGPTYIRVAGQVQDAQQSHEQRGILQQHFP